jgi:voltage-gated potassium channel
MKRKTKKKVLPKNVFEDPEHPWFTPLNNFLALTTLISITSIALETVTSLSAYHLVFISIEYIAVAIFSIEYLARIYLAQKPFRYIFSFFGVIDLIAIIPSYLGLTNLTFLKAARSVRIIRFLRMLRLTRFAHTKRRKNAAQSLYVLNLEIYAVSLLCAVLVLGTAFYLFEGQHAPDIPSGMYLTLLAIIGGVTYPQPVTIGGTVTLILARFVSMLLLGMLISLVGTMLRKLLIGAEKDS